MEKSAALAALAALAQETRLDIYRLLVQAGPERSRAGQIRKSSNRVARELGADEGEETFRAKLRMIARQKLKNAPEKQPTKEGKK